MTNMRVMFLMFCKDYFDNTYTYPVKNAVNKHIIMLSPMCIPKIVLNISKMSEVKANSSFEKLIWKNLQNLELPSF